MPDGIEDTLLVSKAYLIEDTRVMKASDCIKNDKDFKGTGTCDNKHKINKSGSDGIKTQLQNVRKNYPRKMKEPTVR